jgi:two-component system, OmpR family, alkaline phosphatase synthesis response regulator PhoP
MSLTDRLKEAGIPKPRVLVVDDEHGTVDMLKLYFEMFNFEVATAYTGWEALQIVEAEQPDAMILDLMLPDMDGLLVCRRLRENAAHDKLPIIMLSARSEKDDVRRGYEAGATMYFKKPVDLNKLLAEVKQIIAAGGHISPSEARRAADAEAPATGMIDRTNTKP